MEVGYYWAKWDSRFTELLVVYVASSGDCFVTGSDLPYDQDSFIFLSEKLAEPCNMPIG